MTDTLAKLTAFYRIHNPEKLSAGLEQVVAAYAGKEDQLNAALLQQYGQDLSSLDGPSDLKDRLTAFYQIHNPAKVAGADLDKVVGMFKGKEAQLNEALRQQYGTDLSGLSKNWPQASVKFMGGLAAFYRQHNTDRMADGLDGLVEHYVDKPEELNAALMAQYGTGLTSGPGITGSWMIKLKWEQSEYRYPLQVLQDASGKIVGSGSFSVGGSFTVDGSLEGSSLTLKHIVGRRELVTLVTELSRQKYMQGTWTYDQQRGGDISVSPNTGQWSADKLSDESWIFSAAEVEQVVRPTFAPSNKPDFSLLTRLVAFYGVFNPEKLADQASVEKLATAYTDNEYDLNCALNDQYGNDLSDSPGISGIWLFKLVDSSETGAQKTEYRYNSQLLHSSGGKVHGFGYFSPGAMFVLEGEVESNNILRLKQSMGDGSKVITLEAVLSRSKYVKGTWTDEASGISGTWTADKK